MQAVDDLMNTSMDFQGLQIRKKALDKLIAESITLRFVKACGLDEILSRLSSELDEH